MTRIYLSSALAASLLFSVSLPAQPTVNADNTVCFKYRNDSAESVLVDVQFAGRHEMTKGADGVWSVTLGPAARDIYPYCYVVDGVSVMDPENPQWFPNETFKNSLLEMPDASAIYTLNDVPHGAVDYVNYYSKTLGLHGNAIIYTPPFYDRNPDRKYPVMYLISGTTDTEEVYFKVGRMNLILDNLIASGAAKEMIIVLPYGNPSMLLPAGTNPYMMGDLFGKDLVNDLMPFVERNYRTVNDRDHRAIGGFSRGGNQGLAVGLTNLNKFSWLCSYSSFTSMDLPGVYDDAGRLNSLIHLFWLGVGTDDFLYGNAKEYMDFLDRKGIHNVKEFTHDKFGHTWMNARYFLDRTFRLLFSDTPVEYSEPVPEPVIKEKAKAAPAGDEQRLTPEVMARLFPTPLVSPEYNADGSVTFRVRAAGARRVEFESEISEGRKPMMKDSRGDVWSITVTPDRPDLYRYCFVIDGTRVADPCNMFLSPDKGFKYSLADVRAANPAVQDLRDVPHGKVTYRYASSGPYCVYTPAGYDPCGDEELPVLYLGCGEGDSYESWYRTGRANNILDNLIAAGVARRMVVVMSWSPEVAAAVAGEYNVGESFVDSFVSDNWTEKRDHLEKTVAKLFQPESVSAVEESAQILFKK